MGLAYSTLATVKRQMDTSDARFWSVCDSNGNLVAECDKKNAATRTVDDSFLQMSAVIDDMSGDYVKIVIRTKAANTDEESGEYKRGNVKGNTTYTYFVPLAPPKSQHAMSGFSGVGGPESYIREIYDLKAQLQAKDNEMKLQQMQNQIAGLSAANGKEGLMEKMFNKIAEGFVNKLTGAQIKQALEQAQPGKEKEPVKTEPVAGPSEDSEPEEGATEKNVVVEFLTNTASAMGDKGKAMQAIDALAKMAKAQPETFAETADQLILMYGKKQG